MQNVNYIHPVFGFFKECEAKITENTNTIVKHTEEHAAKVRGDRLKMLRSLTGLTREEFCENKSGLNPNTCKDWELGRLNGLTLKGAELVIAHIAQYNVVCSLDWLMYGKGAAPMVLTANPAIAITNASIQKELSIFEALFQNVLYVEIKETMNSQPYQFGDVVAGVKLPIESIAALTGQICLVETTEGEILVVKLLKSLGNNRFLLSLLSGDKQQEASLISAARITRLYRL
ncbi:MAG: hypothetical protein K2Q14_00480 [Gammaproteobacteria bacterium]|nr:hypothetical protein [Gammaproteobacteria bacterium]